MGRMGNLKWMRTGADTPASWTVWLGALTLVASCGADGSAEARPEPNAGSTAGSTYDAEQLPDAHEFTLEEPRSLVTRDDAFLITWFPENGVVPINDHFSVDVTLTRNDEARTPVTGASVTMSCFMPEHGHGMLREPRSEEIGDGKYRVNGFLLHMDGYWTVSVNVLVEGLAASAGDELRL